MTVVFSFLSKGGQSRSSDPLERGRLSCRLVSSTQWLPLPAVCPTGFRDRVFYRYRDIEPGGGNASLPQVPLPVP